MALMALMVAIFATVAYAAVIEGTPRPDVLRETPENDTIYAKAGDDTVRAGIYGRDADVLYGMANDDTLRARDGDNRDTLRGGRGYDVCVGDEFDLYAGCEEINGVVQ